MVRFPAEAHIFILNFSLTFRVNSSTKTRQMKSSMTFIHSNGCTEIHLILKKMEAIYINMTICQL